MSSLGPEEFSAELAAWLSQAEGRISVDPARWRGASVSVEGGERVFVFDRGDDGWITVLSSERGGVPRPRFRTPSLEVVERFLANEAGPAGRLGAGLVDDVRVPFRLEELPPGAELRRVRGGALGGREVLTIDGTVVGEFGFSAQGVAAHSDAVAVSSYATASIATIAQSYLSPDGSPLFTLR